MTSRPRVASAADLSNLPGYTDSVDPTTQPIRTVVTHYTIKPMIPCGLKGCRQPHFYGYVVALVDGGVTNVGHVCGEQFGQRFVDERKKYADNIIRPEATKRVGAAKIRFSKMQMELHGLRSETNEICNLIQRFKAQFQRLTKDIERRAHNGDDRVFESIRRSEDEIETLMAAGSGRRREDFLFREEMKGRIPGLKIFATRLRELIVTNLVDRAEALRDTELGSISTDKLLDLDRWAFDFDESLESAKSLLAAGKAFFTPETFQLLACLPLPKTDIDALKTLTASSLGKPSPGDVKQTKPHPATLSKKETDRQKNSMLS